MARKDSAVQAVRPADLLPTETDVLVVGAGIAGIGAGCHLRRESPDTSFLIVEAAERLGGTWQRFSYPGLRSDSDLRTFAYEFKPWTARNVIADGSEILDYLHECVREYDLAQRIRFGWKVTGADWNSELGRWQVSLTHRDGSTGVVRARWLWGATGYYDHAGGFRPTFEGEADFRGRIVHAQDWTDDIEHHGKRVVVVGSGATAITIVPAISDTAAQVTMLQRSPSYIVPLPAHDPLAAPVNALLPDRAAHAVLRRVSLFRDRFLYRLCRNRPGFSRWLVREMNRRALPKDFPIDTHFKPTYEPWDQRLCMARDGDFFEAISSGRADVVTDQIARFTPTGIELASGEHLDADLVVLATGLRLLPLGGMTVSVDGAAIDLPEHVIFKGFMLSDVPNFAFAFGYTNFAWTLKVDLVWEHAARLIEHQRTTGQGVVTPRVTDPTLEFGPMIDMKSGYLQRGMPSFPQRGSHGPWSLVMDYPTDRARLRTGPVTDPALEFSAAQELVGA